MCIRDSCSTCNQGAKNLTLEKPSAMWLLQQMRRASYGDQKIVFEWLLGRMDPGHDTELEQPPQVLA